MSGEVKYNTRPESCLNAYSNKLLREIAQQWDVATASKAIMSSQLMDRLSSPTVVSSKLKKLELDDLRLLAILNESPGGVAISLQFLRSAHFKGVSQVNFRYKSLLGMGLILVAMDEGAQPLPHTAAYNLESRLPVYLLPVVADLLPEIAARPPVFDDPGIPMEGTLRSDRPVRILREFDLVLTYVDEHPVEITKGGHIKVTYMKRMQKTLAAYLPSIGSSRILLLLNLCNSRQFLSDRQQPYQYRLTPEGYRTQQKEPIEKLALLWQAATDPGFDFDQLEYFRQSQLNDRYRSYYDLQYMMLRVHEDWPLLADILKLASHDRWVRIQDLVDYAGSEFPFMFFRMYNPGYAPSAQIPERPNETQRTIQQTIVAGFIEEIAFPLGVVDWAIGPKRRLLVRLTELGQYLLGKIDRKEYERNRKAPLAVDDGHPAIVVQPDFEIISFADRLHFEELQSLYDVAMPVGDPSPSDPVRRFKLTKETVQWAVNRGQTPNGILSRLRKLNGTDLPGNVETEFKEWVGSLEQATVYRGFDLLQFHSQAQRDKAMSRYDDAQAVGDRFLLTAETKEKATEKDVVDYESPVEKTLSVSAEGLLQLHDNKPPDLQTLSLLDGLADSRGGNRWMITRQLVQQMNMPLNEMVRRLEKRCHHLPAPLYARLQGWGGGSPELPNALLRVVEIQDERIVRGLVKDKAASQFIRGAIGKNLLAVDEKDWTAFQAALEEFGLAVDPKRSPDFGDANRPMQEGEVDMNDLSGFQLVAGKQKRQLLQQAIDKGRPIGVLYLKQRNRYGSPTLQCEQLLAESLPAQRNWAVFLDSALGYRVEIELRHIKALRL